ARIHETNLKKQGMVPLTFADPATYDLIEEDDRINVLGLPPVPGQPVRCQIVKPSGETIDFECTHTFSDEQVEWFKAGSALNIVRQMVAAGNGPGCAAPSGPRRSVDAGLLGRRVGERLEFGDANARFEAHLGPRPVPVADPGGDDPPDEDPADDQH